MNIGIDIRSIMYGQYTGVGEYTFHLLDNLFKQDKTNQYFLFCNSAKPIKLPDWDYPNVHKVTFTYPNKFLHGSMFLFKRPRIQKMVEKKIGKTLDHIFLPNQNFFVPVKDTPLTITVHDLSFVRFPYFFPRFHRFWHKAVNLRGLCQKATNIIAISEHTANDLQELWGINPAKIKVINPGLDPMFFNGSGHREETIKAKYQLPSQYLLYLGTLEPRKNVEIIIKSFDAIAKDYPQLNLVLAGGWGWETVGIKLALKNSQFKDRIKLLGYVERDDKPALYRLAKVFLFPSHYEGFGLPPVEALSQGCPVITSNTSSLPEAVKDGAILIQPHDLGALERGILEVLKWGGSFALNGKPIAQAYQWEETIRKVKGVIVGV